MSLFGAGSTDVFIVIDPRGYSIRCTRECWNNHVVSEHKSLVGYEDDVALTIKEPEMGLMYRDRSFANRQVYYKRDGTRRFYIKAIVEVDHENHTGELITAFHTANKREGEMPIWRV